MIAGAAPQVGGAPTGGKVTRGRLRRREREHEKGLNGDEARDEHEVEELMNRTSPPATTSLKQGRLVLHFQLNC